jgi:hypothetical protein
MHSDSEVYMDGKNFQDLIMDNANMLACQKNHMGFSGLQPQAARSCGDLSIGRMATGGTTWTA